MREQRLEMYGNLNARELGELVRDFKQLYPFMQIGYEQLRSTEVYRRAMSDLANHRGSADFIWSSAIHLQMKLINDGYAQPYHSPEAPDLPDWAIWRNEGWGITAEPVVIVYNRRLLPSARAPHSHDDLLRLVSGAPAFYRRKIVTLDPARSEVGYLFATEDVRLSRDTWRLVGAFGRAEVQLFTSATDMLDAVASGRALIAYNVIGSYALERQKTNPDLVVVFPSDYTLISPRIALIPEAAAHPNAAKLFLDYLLSKRGQAKLSTQSIGSVRKDVPLRAAGPSASAAQPIRVGPGLLSDVDRLERARFLDRWNQAMVGPKALF